MSTNPNPTTINLDPVRGVGMIRFDVVEATPTQIEAARDRAHLEAETRRTILQQIGTGNVLAISGGRWHGIAKGADRIGVELPVSGAWSVWVLTDPDDTYRVARVRRRRNQPGFPEIVSVSGIHAEQVGEAAYRASCFDDEWPAR